MAKTRKEENKTVVAQNKRAFRNFFILDRYEAGIVLAGSEVKSVREHRINLKDSYARLKNDEIFLYNLHISPYTKSRVEDINPTRVRKLLLHRKEIDKLSGKLSDKSLTIVPLSIYTAGSFVKVELALAKGKLKGDKRKDIQERESELEVKRVLKARLTERNKKFK
ncbi:MAG: SsrA-binding protein SmpB [Actinobacteria bacterium]|nr:SsrA-binding protein SmpB [Actinomycetota bacterium]